MRDRAQELNLEANWKSFEKDVKATLPRCADYVHHLSTYVANQAPELVQELGTFVKALFSYSGRNRACGSEWWAKLNSLKFGNAERFPLVLSAMVKANLSAPRLVDGICRLISPTAVGTLASANARDGVRQAEAIMHQARKALAGGGLDEAQVVRIYVFCCFFFFFFF